MNLDNIEAFVFVIHYGSFNKAAEALFLSQPSVSARIQSLERELDCELFDRSGKKVYLTEKGERFLPYAQQILQSFRKGKQQLQQKKSVPKQVRIGSTISVSSYIMPYLLPSFKEKHPEATVKLVTASSDDILAKVLSKELDFGFVRNLSHPGVQSVRVYEDPIRLYVYKDHPFVGSESLSIADVASQPLVFFECGALDWLRVHRLFDRVEVPPDIEYHVDNLEAAKRLVTCGRGVCFLPELSARQETEAGRLVQVNLSDLDGISLQTNLISPLGESHAFGKTMLDLGQSLLHSKLS